MVEGAIYFEDFQINKINIIIVYNILSWSNKQFCNCNKLCFLNRWIPCFAILMLYLEGLQYVVYKDPN